MPFRAQKRLWCCFADRSGAIVVIVALCMAVLLAFAGLVVDLGYVAWVKAELQRAADAGALAGARALAPYTGTLPAPNWSSGGTIAAQTVKENSADNQLLTDCQVQSGYWSLSSQTLSGTGITPTSTDVPAIQVTVTKTARQEWGAAAAISGTLYRDKFPGRQRPGGGDVTRHHLHPSGGGIPLCGPAQFHHQSLE